MGNFISWVNFKATDSCSNIDENNIVCYSKLQSKEWDHQIRKIYKQHSKLKNKHISLINEMLSGYLKCPSEFAQKKHNEIILLVNDDELLGMVAIKPLLSECMKAHAELFLFVVDPVYKNDKKYINILMKATHDWIDNKNNNYTSFYLNCVESDIETISLYEQTGMLEEISKLRKYNKINQNYEMYHRYVSKHATIQKETEQFFESN